jgi:Flp pilus assembly pilin Flp
MMKKLWMDEGGATLSAELALIGTILVIGMVVGLSAVQDAVVAELADLGQAIANLDQSYSYHGVEGHGASSSGSIFTDALDFCDDDGTGTPQESKCVALCAAPTAEGE